MPDSENVMGWDVKNNGLHVIFKKHSFYYYQLARTFHRAILIDQELYSEQLTHFIAHPGGKRY